MFKLRPRSSRLRVLEPRELALVTGGGDGSALKDPDREFIPGQPTGQLANEDRGFVPGNVRGQP
jgi:hypothetical protein